MHSNKGIFCISLDFELHWGCFETNRLQTAAEQTYFANTRATIPKMLQIFQEYHLHVTWATVGMLFLHNELEWRQQLPSLLPSYANNAVNAYHWIEKNGFVEPDGRFHFAPNLIQQIQATPHQEIGTHTYSHYYCLEMGQTANQFAADLQKAIAVGKAAGVSIKSLVFPRNQINTDYLNICQQLGITSVRSNPRQWFWRANNKAPLIQKIARTADAYLPISRQTVPLPLLQQPKSPLQLPASRLYRPWQPQQTIGNYLKMQRILKEMTFAAQHGNYYHLWWHPHNFGKHPQACLNELQQIANHYWLLQKKYGFQSLNMGEITQAIQNG